MTSWTTRFAPSPTGHLHLGHAYSALLASDMAQAQTGTCLLRMDDLDQTRCRPAYETAIYEDLSWLGLRWPEPVLCQSTRSAAYLDALQTLQSLGVVYRCFLTRKDLMAAITSAPHDEDDALPVYRGPDQPLSPAEEAEKLAQGDAFAWRLSMRAAKAHLGARFTIRYEDHLHGEHREITILPDALGDVVIARKDTVVSYHLATVVDDAAQAITDIIRGDDLVPSTPVQILLQRLLDLPTPRYHHHKLILDEDGKRFAKRNSGVTLRALRQEGVTPAQLRARLGLSTT